VKVNKDQREAHSNDVLSFRVPLTFKAEAQKDGKATQVKVNGVAYSGGVIPNYGWMGDIAIDLSSIEFPKQVFGLLNHDFDRLAGNMRLALVGNQLNTEGELFSGTPEGQLVSNTMAEGAEWSLSLGVNGKRRWYDEKTKVQLNGRELEVDMVLENARVLEVSFVPSGADPGAYAVQLSRYNQPTNPEGDDPTMDPKKTETPAATQPSAEELRLKAENEALLKQLADVKLAARKAACEAAGVKLSAEQEATVAKMDDAAFDLMKSTFATKPAGDTTNKSDVAPNLPDNLTKPGARVEGDQSKNLSFAGVRETPHGKALFKAVAALSGTKPTIQ
jgi:hypothetical protein